MEELLSMAVLANYTAPIEAKRKYSPIAPLEKLAVGMENKTEGRLLVFARIAMKRAGHTYIRH